MARRLAGLVGLLIAAACGGVDPAATTSTVSSVATPPTAAIDASTTEAVALLPSSVLAISSGRGDDSSLEVSAWLASDPFDFADHRVVVGVDADDSFSGTGDPLPHLDAHLEVTSSSASLSEGSQVVASGPDLEESVSWRFADGVLRVFFLGRVPPRAGTIWVFVQTGGVSVLGGAAGAPFGTDCSYHGAGLELPPVPDRIPDPGSPCRYPTG